MTHSNNHTKPMKKTAKKTATKQARRVLRRGEAVIQQSHTEGGREVYSDRRGTVDDLPEHVAHVKVSGGLTRQLQPFEFARLDVSISIPCAPDDDSIQETYLRCSKLVEELLEKECDSAGI